jgi:branched-chain amino acid aminotransferase
MKALIDGEVLPLMEARLPLADHGFLYGDSVYETLRSFGGQLFELRRHLTRLRCSAAGVYLEVPWSDDDLALQIESFRHHLEGQDHYLRVIVTRGVGEFNYLAASDGPRLVLIGGPFFAAETDSLLAGLRLTVVARRRNPADSLSPGLKTSNLLNARLAAMEARQSGFDDALMVNFDDNLTEGTTSNIFLVFPDGCLATPSVNSGLLEGVTRTVLLQLASEIGLTIEERLIHRRELTSATEAFFCSSTRSVAPIRSVDEHQLTPVPGPVTLRLMDAFRQRAGGL